MKHIFSVCLILLSYGITLASEGGLVLNGSWSFNVGKTTVRITGNEITNESDYETSGSILLEMYLTKQKYDGNSLSGQKVFSRSYKSLEPNSYFGPIDLTHDILPVNPGTYYVTLAVLEYVDGEYMVVDYLNFDAMCTISSSESTTAPQLEGNWSVSNSLNGEYKNQLSIAGGAIVNNSEYATDNIKLKIFGSVEPFDGKLLNGYTLCEINYDPLGSKYAFNDNNFSYVIDKLPPNGRYHVAILLYVKENNDYVLADYKNLYETIIFR